jgi:hypothetical protein
MHGMQTSDKRLLAQSSMNVKDLNALKTPKDLTHGRTSSRWLELIGDGLLRFDQTCVQPMYVQAIDVLAWGDLLEFLSAFKEQMRAIYCSCSIAAANAEFTLPNVVWDQPPAHRK